MGSRWHNTWCSSLISLFVQDELPEAILKRNNARHEAHKALSSFLDDVKKLPIAKRLRDIEVFLVQLLSFIFIIAKLLLMNQNKLILFPNLKHCTKRSAIQNFCTKYFLSLYLCLCGWYRCRKIFTNDLWLQSNKCEDHNMEPRFIHSGPLWRILINHLMLKTLWQTVLNCLFLSFFKKWAFTLFIHIYKHIHIQATSKIC